MPTETPSSDPVVAEFRKNARDCVLIRFTEFNDYKLADIRVWFEDEHSGKLRPGKGFAIRRELLPDMRDAVEAAIRALQDTVSPEP